MNTIANSKLIFIFFNLQSENAYTKKSHKYLLEYVKQHLHIIFLKFDKFSNNSEDGRAVSSTKVQEIKEKLESNRKMYRVIRHYSLIHTTQIDFFNFLKVYKTRNNT